MCIYVSNQKWMVHGEGLEYVHVSNKKMVGGEGLGTHDKIEYYPISRQSLVECTGINLSTVWFPQLLPSPQPKYSLITGF